MASEALRCFAERVKTCYFAVWVAALLVFTSHARAVTPPVVRSTYFDGSRSNIVRYAPQPWMNSNNVQLTAEAWVYCEELSGAQTFIARHDSTNLWFGVSGGLLRFYRSGGTYVDSDAMLVPLRWTHVAVTYDGATARFYINGTNAGVSALAHTGNNSTNSLCLGGQTDLVNFGDLFSGGYALRGYLDEVRLWSVVRTTAQILSGLNQELRVTSGLLATFGSGGEQNDLRPEGGTTMGTPIAARESGFGILPRDLCIPFLNNNSFVLDGEIDRLNEYRGAETMVLRSTDLNSSTPDMAVYLIRNIGGTNDHLYVGVPDLPTAGLPLVPRLQVLCDVDPFKGNSPDLGDWECRLTQDGFQGGTRYDVDPPFYPLPHWMCGGRASPTGRPRRRVPSSFTRATSSACTRST